MHSVPNIHRKFILGIGRGRYLKFLRFLNTSHNFNSTYKTNLSIIHWASSASTSLSKILRINMQYRPMKNEENL